MHTQQIKLAAAQAALHQATLARDKALPEVAAAIAAAIAGAREHILDQCPPGTILRPVAEELASQAERLVSSDYPGINTEAAYLAMRADGAIGEALWRIASGGVSGHPLHPFRQAAAAALRRSEEAIKTFARAEKFAREVAEEPEKARLAEEAKAKAEADERHSQEMILGHLTASEQFLHGRGRLNLREVRSRLEAKATNELESALEKCPKPGRIYAGPMEVLSGHSYSYKREQWQPSWVRTIQCIERVTNHPVVSVCEDCIDLNTHVSVPWNSTPIEVRVRFYRPSSPETDEADD